MNILTDILSLIKRGKFTNVASNDDVIVLGMWNETRMILICRFG